MCLVSSFFLEIGLCVRACDLEFESCFFVTQCTVLAFGVLKQVIAVLIVEPISLEDFCAGLFNPVLCLKGSLVTAGF